MDALVFTLLLVCVNAIIHVAGEGAPPFCCHSSSFGPLLIPRLNLIETAQRDRGGTRSEAPGGPRDPGPPQRPPETKGPPETPRDPQRPGAPGDPGAPRDPQRPGAPRPKPALLEEAQRGAVSRGHADLALHHSFIYQRPNNSDEELQNC